MNNKTKTAIELKTEMEILKQIKIPACEKRLDYIQNKLNRMDEKNSEFDKLVRRLKANKKFYEDYMKRFRKLQDELNTKINKMNNTELMNFNKSL